MTTPAPGHGPGKHTARALLGYVLDTQLSGAVPEREVSVPSPWDAWWACYRAGLPLAGLAPGVRVRDHACPSCARRALRLAGASPPGHPGTGPQACGCLLKWAERMRGPGPRVTWPPVSLSLALIKPGAPEAPILGLLAQAFEVLASRQLTLATADTRRMYPEAYGASYVRDRDAYLTSGPVRVLILHSRRPGTDPGAVKTRIRRARVPGDLDAARPAPVHRGMDRHQPPSLPRRRPGPGGRRRLAVPGVHGGRPGPADRPRRRARRRRPRVPAVPGLVRSRPGQDRADRRRPGP